MKEDYKFEELLCQRATLSHTPINAILELTPLCNMNCEMCFVRLSSEEQRAKGKLLSLEEWENLADQMKEAGTLFVLLTGGEPLLYPGFREFYLYLQQLGMIITLNTNGTLIDEDWADFFAEHRPRRINITIYGKDEKTYEKLCHYASGYEKTVQGIRLLKERGVDVKVNGSITPYNVEDALAIAELSEQLDVPWKIDTYMYPGHRERNQCFQEKARLSAAAAARIRTLLMRKRSSDFQKTAADFVEKAEEILPETEESRAFSCRGGRSSFAINWQGHLRPCIMVTQPEVDVRSRDFLSAWDELVRLTEEITSNAACRSCSMRAVCQTCAACAFLETGHYDGVPTYMCDYTKATIACLKGALADS